MEIILYSQVLLLFFRKGCKILLPPRAEAYMPTPEASDQGLGIGFIFPPHRAVFAVRLILFHLIVHRYYPPYNQGRLPCRPLVPTFPHSFILLQGIQIYEIAQRSQSQRSRKSPAPAGSLEADHYAIYSKDK